MTIKFFNVFSTKTNGCCTLKDEMTKAFNENLDHTDVTLISKSGEEIPCHKFILVARIPVFKSMFDVKEYSEDLKGQIEILDASTEAIKSLRKYLYTDSIGEYYVE